MTAGNEVLMELVGDCISSGQDESGEETSRGGRRTASVERAGQKYPQNQVLKKMADFIKPGKSQNRRAGGSK